MSLAGFKASNHPQQTGKRGANDAVDDRGTDAATFAEWDRRFGFTMDVAAAQHNAKCKRYYTLERSGLEHKWTGSVWCNPPYSDIGTWVRKAWMEWQGYAPDDLPLNRVAVVNNRPHSIVMLLPANRVEQAWWQDLVEPVRDRPGSDLRVEFLRGRLRFDRPQAVIGPKGDRPPFGCALLIWGGVA